MQTNGKMDFTIGGNKISMSKKDVENAVRDVEPTSIKKYWVEISRKHYPIKQVVSLVSNIPTVAFGAGDAYRILTRLGFDVKV